MLGMISHCKYKYINILNQITAIKPLLVKFKEQSIQYHEVSLGLVNLEDDTTVDLVHTTYIPFK